ncbi:hypothetical protein HMPREF0083_04068 [Aneurinibacillus aneurinilyticus ATCC 12856]|uniref:Uncharacterized protein n=1 Tax=Aneurinibacillus aneurinilyticus ATCC 12856 TaxID=649747 RepID=U1YAJ9_ANEAE|nr:hypothetical protein HMPREF0083_04068 [Aneurinibacillus aneurinilyticus ATCC 12856]
MKQTDKEIQTKKSLINAFEKLKTANYESVQQLWQEIDSFEKVLDDIVHESTERYSNNIEKNQEIINLYKSRLAFLHTYVSQKLSIRVLKPTDKETIRNENVKNHL